jgi:hypothetical protein
VTLRQHRQEVHSNQTFRDLFDDVYLTTDFKPNDLTTNDLAKHWFWEVLTVHDFHWLESYYKSQLHPRARVFVGLWDANGEPRDFSLWTSLKPQLFTGTYFTHHHRLRAQKLTHADQAIVAIDFWNLFRDMDLRDSPVWLEYENRPEVYGVTNVKMVEEDLYLKAQVTNLGEFWDFIRKNNGRRN